MTLATRTILILVLILAAFGEAPAQETTATGAASAQPTTTTATATTQPATTTQPEPSGQISPAQQRLQAREAFEGVLMRHPPKLADILVLDPTLLSNQAFLARYPDVEQFIAEHPEIRRNPHYYLQSFNRPIETRPDSAFEEVFETLSIIFIFTLIAAALAWLIRTIIEQRRWNQLSRRQSEVHNKILERFSTSEELLEYIRSPAGSKFLESAPIPVRTAPARSSGPLARVIWSIQIGVIVAAAGLGMLLVSLRFAGETAQGFFAMGMIVFSVGAGFIGSGLISTAVSRRLGASETAGSSPSDIVDDAGMMR